MQSGGLPFVAVVQAADFGSHHDGARCRADGRETERLDRPTERRVEGRVAVVEEEPRVHVVGKGLAELLSCPSGRWVRRHMGAASH